MKILTLWHDLPSPFTGDSLALYNLLKYLSTKHEVTLLSFKEKIDESRYIYDLNQYCEVLEPQSITIQKSLIKGIIHDPVDTLSPRKLFSPYFSLYNTSPMNLRIRNLLLTRKFDLIYTSVTMACYVYNIDLPKVVHEFDCFTEASRQKYLGAHNVTTKFRSWIGYLIAKRYEENISDKFDAFIFVSPHEQTAFKSLFPSAKAIIIPNGVDQEFFSPIYGQEEYPSLVFVGDMSYEPNIDAMLYFYSKVFVKIKENLPETKLYIVGRNPSKEIQNLSSDESVVITGYVEDVRVYLAHASVVLAPFISGTPGIKNKVLEAMAMAKPVVSTSLGVDGITKVSVDNVIIADGPDALTKQVIKLLCNEQLRHEIGYNARRLVESSYSWGTMAEKLDKVFEETLEDRHL